MMNNNLKSLAVRVSLLISTITVVQGFLLPTSSDIQTVLLASRSHQNNKQDIRTKLQESSTTKEANEAATTTLEDNANQISPTFFRTNAMPLFLEDTDAYGVMFNANYMKFYERALQTELPYFSSSSSTSTSTSERSFIITHVTKHKFKRSVTLDDQYIIQGEKIGQDEDNENGLEQWKMEMILYDGNDIDNDSDQNLVCNSAILTLSYLPQKHGIVSDNDDMNKDSSTSIPNTKSIESSFKTFRDEFSPLTITTAGTLTRTAHLPFHSILNYFERLRTIAIGGPALLNRAKSEDGIVFVVTSIDNLSLSNNDLMEDLDRHNDIIGEDVTVRTTSNLKRGGMIIECQQQLFTTSIGREEGSEKNKLASTSPFLIAKGTVVICAVDTRNGYRPTKNIPDYVRQLFE